jgi:hypothetical protein
MVLEYHGTSTNGTRIAPYLPVVAVVPHRLGLAAEAYAAVKAAKYADQDNFIPFILDTGGRVN